ncbi:MAG TPA: hypothetical protein VGI98_02110 [Candidatus Limnocylindrales bacterium]|jgi:hypothetical protein
MIASRPIARAVAVCLVAASLAACSAAPATVPAGSLGSGSLGSGSLGSGATQGEATTGPGGSQASTGGGGGSTADICALLSPADISSFLAKPFTATGPTPGEAQSCSWRSDDLTSVYAYRTDPGECDDTKASLTPIAGVQGADFAGSSAGLGATFAGSVKGGACYVIEVAPTERAPQPDVLGQLLQQFVQVMGA